MSSSAAFKHISIRSRVGGGGQPTPNNQQQNQAGQTTAVLSQTGGGAVNIPQAKSGSVTRGNNITSAITPTSLSTRSNNNLVFGKQAVTPLQQSTITVNKETGQQLNQANRRKEASSISMAKGSSLNNHRTNNNNKNKTPMLGTLQIQNTDYYSVQSSNSSRNVSSASGTAQALPKKVTNHQASSSSIRNSTSSRNNYSMIKSSNIIVTQPVQLNTASGNRFQKNINNTQQHHQYSGSTDCASPPMKVQRTSVVGVINCDPIIESPTNQYQDSVIATMNSDQNKDQSIKIAQFTIENNGKNKSHSQERSLQRGLSATKHDPSLKYVGCKQRMSIIQQQIQHQYMPSLGATRRTSNNGVSPLQVAHCQKHQKPHISPIKQDIYVLQSVQQLKPSSPERKGLHSQSQAFPYYPAPQQKGSTDDLFQSKSLILQNTPVPHQHQPNLAYKSPQNFKKQPFVQGVGSATGSPNPPITSRQESKKVGNPRLSTDRSSGLKVQELSQVRKPQQVQFMGLQNKSSRIIHSKVVSTNMDSNQQPLQIDLQMFQNKSIKKQLNHSSTSVKPYTEIDLDDHPPSLVYGASGDLGTQGSAGFEINPSPDQQPSIALPQHLLLQLNSQSPVSQNLHFFAKSPKTCQKLINKQNGSKTQMNFQQQTKSSMAKSNKQKNNNNISHSNIQQQQQPQQQTSTQESAQKSKTQRMYNAHIAVRGQNHKQSSNKTAQLKPFDSVNKKPSMIPTVMSPIPQNDVLLKSHSLQDETLKIESVTKVVQIDANQFIKPNNIDDYTIQLLKPSTKIFPMTKQRFIELNKATLPEALMKELTETVKQEIIYFPGLTLEGGDDGDGLSYDDEEGYYKIKIGDQLAYRYEVLKILGKGSFAQVVACRDWKDSGRGGEEKMVAIKITRNTELDHKFAQSEAKLLKYLMDKDPEDTHNIVRLIDEFSYRDHHCFVFELLTRGDLFENLKASGFTGFQLPLIKHYAKEILKALLFLEQNQIIHCDLKPENILLADDQANQNSQAQPLKLKLVDFGSGSFRGEQVYTYVQSRFYRAPEVILRLLPPPHSYTEKVDIWSLGCILVELFTGEPLFPGNNEQEQLELIMELCGIPPNSLIDRCRKREYYFDVDYSPFLIEDEEVGILRIPDSKKFEKVIQTDDQGFISFVKKCLELDPDARMSASQALEHPWIKEAPVFIDRLITNESALSMAPGDPENLRNDLGCLSQLDDYDPNTIKNHTFYRQDSNVSQLPSSRSQLAFLAASSQMRRRDEDQESGARGTQFEESPVREVNNEKPKKSLAQHFTIQTVNLLEDDDNEMDQRINNDSDTSTPKNEGGIQIGSQTNSNMNISEEIRSSQIKHQNPQQQEVKRSAQSFENKPSLNTSMEKRRDRSSRKKLHEGVVIQSLVSPSKGSLIVQESPLPKVYESQQQNSQNIQIIGHYEIFREDEARVDGRNPAQVPLLPDVRESVNSRTSGIASEANIPPFNVNHQAKTQINSKLPFKSPVKVPLSPVKKHQQIKPVLKSGGDSHQSASLVQSGTQENNTINKITITFYQKRNVNGGGAGFLQKK